jgi:adenylyltransferase/sulfurtransferase
VHAGNVEQIIGGATLVLDGTDNASTRYLLNDACVKHSIPWVYGACVGVEGRTMLIQPAATPCLRCIFPEPPTAGELPTCDTVGVLASVANIVASLQVISAIRFILGNVNPLLLTLEAWSAHLRSLDLSSARADNCRTCRQRQFDFLDRPAGHLVSLCGRDAVQVQPISKKRAADSIDLAARLQAVGEVQRTPYFLRCTLREFAPLRLTIFPDGRTIVHGTSDPVRARAIYDRCIGS